MAAKFNKLESDYQSLLTECGILKCKLECKTEALIILSHELDRNRSERDQYKLMADQLRERYSALKKRVEGWGPSLLGVYDVHGLKGEREQSLVQLLCELKEQNKSLQFEVDDLKQRLMDAQGDIKILREKMTRKDSNSLYDEHSVCKQFPPCEREELVGQLEIMRNKGLLLERDLQAVLDEKEELVTARDAYRHKFERLNQQLNCILRGDQQTVVDIDGVVMENRYLQERIKQVQEEKTMISATLSKCRAMLEKKRPRNNQRFNAISSGLAIGAKQVEQLLQNNPFLETSNNSADLRNLIMTLLEALSDKALALSHQKKTNKLLGNRIAELEQKVKTIKAPPFWQDSGQLTYLLRSTSAEDSQSIDNTSLSPQHSVSSPGAVPPIPVNYLSPMSSETASEEQLLCVKVDDEFSISQLGRSNSCFSDLDFLPTKENVSKEYELSRSESISSCSSHVSEPKSNTPTSRMPYHRTSGVCIAKESSPLKSVLRTSSINSLHKAISFSERPKSPDLDLDDLPPKLQKLLSAALAEIEQQSSSQKKSKSPSPVHDRNAKKDIDPSC